MPKFTFMKNVLFCCLCFASISSFGQNGFFLEPGLGLGYTNVRASNPPDQYPFQYGAEGWYNRSKNIFSYNPSLLIGYKHKSWSLTTGISFLKTGYNEDQLYFMDLGTNEPNDKITEFYYHIMVPLIFSEQFNIGKHFFIRPGFGFAVSYNTTAIENFEETGIYYNAGAGKNQPLTKDEFDQIYFRFIGWEILRLQAGYKVNDRVNIIAGPEYQFMLSSFIKDNDNYELNRAATFKVGITWSFSKQTTPNPGNTPTEALKTLRQ